MHTYYFVQHTFIKKLNKIDSLLNLIIEVACIFNMFNKLDSLNFNMLMTKSIEI